MTQSDFERVYKAVRLIPPGKVASYGQVARWLGWPRGARTVGWALRALRDSDVIDVPWYRVINAQGRISLVGDEGPRIQQKLLEAEGVVFDDTGRIDLKIYGWSGPVVPWWEEI
ncbi:MAG: MGMT family protein [Anaerolineae bacterium]|nr:MGMT family protein [Anaerolineae bacterium]